MHLQFSCIGRQIPERTLHVRHEGDGGERVHLANARLQPRVRGAENPKHSGAHGVTHVAQMRVARLFQDQGCHGRHVVESHFMKSKIKNDTIIYAFIQI
jgi:hypothetical protein